MHRESCESVRVQLLDLLDGTIDRDRKVWLRSHLAECAPCVRDLEVLRESWAGLPEGSNVVPPGEIRERILAYAGEAATEPPVPLSHPRRPWGQWIAVGGIVSGLAAALAIGVALRPDAQSPVAGVHAPDFTAANVETGEMLTFADYEGDVVLLNIWATWCVPCEVEMPSIERLHQRLGPRGLKIVAVSVDYASSGHVRDWARERDLTFDILHDRAGQIEIDYQLTGVPETFVINRRGEIVKRLMGPVRWDDPVQSALLETLLDSD